MVLVRKELSKGIHTFREDILEEANVLPSLNVTGAKLNPVKVPT